MLISKGLDLDLDSAEKHIDSAQSYLRSTEKVFRFGAVAIPLNKILDNGKAPLVIDFLSLDVEGAELEVLKGIDFEKYKFKYMLIECRNFKRLEKFLNRKNSQFVEKLSQNDYLFSHEF